MSVKFSSRSDIHPSTSSINFLGGNIQRLPTANPATTLFKKKKTVRNIDKQSIMSSNTLSTNSNVNCDGNNTTRSASTSSEPFLTTSNRESLQSHLRHLLPLPRRTERQVPASGLSLFTNRDCPKSTDYTDRRELLNALLTEAIKIFDDDDDDDYLFGVAHP